MKPPAATFFDEKMQQYALGNAIKTIERLEKYCKSITQDQYEKQIHQESFVKKLEQKVLERDARILELQKEIQELRRLRQEEEQRHAKERYQLEGLLLRQSQQLVLEKRKQLQTTTALMATDPSIESTLHRLDLAMVEYSNFSLPQSKIKVVTNLDHQ